MNGVALDRIVDVLRSLLDRTVEWIPDLVIGLVLVLVALMSAKLVEVVCRAVLRRDRLHEFLGRTGVEDTLQRVGIRRPLEEFVPRVLYFLVLFLFVRTGAQELGLDAIAEVIGTTLGYLPNVLAAVLILLGGSVAARVVGTYVTTSSREYGVEFAASIGRFVTGVILFVCGVVAVSQLRIDTEIVSLVVGCVLAGLALAFGLSFGLGTRGITRNIVAGYYARKVLETGRAVEVSGEKGILVAITPTQAILKQNGQMVSIPNEALLAQTVKQDDR